MKKNISIGAILVSAVLAMPSSRAADTVEQLKNCARIQDDTSRIACYEALGQSVLAAESSTTKDASTAAVSTAAEPQNTKGNEIPDSIGGGKYARGAGVTAAEFRGKIKSCQKSVDKRWFYIFENDQIWKQVQHRRLRHKTCSVGATLTRDGFGYILLIDNENRKIRVKRHR